MRLIDRLNCLIGNHKYRGVDIICVANDTNELYFRRTCMFCGNKQLDIINAVALERYADRIHKEMMKMDGSDEHTTD